MMKKIKDLITKLREEGKLSLIDIVLILLVVALIIVQGKIVEQSQRNDRLAAEYQHKVYIDLYNLNLDAERILAYENH